LTRRSLIRDRRPTFWLAPEMAEAGRQRRMPNPLTVLNGKETRDTAVAATATSLTFVVSPLAMAILVGDIVGSRVKHAYQRLTRVISVRNGVTDSTYLAETLIPLVAIGLPLSPIAAGAAAPLFNAPPVFTVGGEGQEMNNLHTMLTAPQFLIFSLVGVLLAGLVAYPLTVRYARRAALFVARRLSHEAVIGAFAGLVLVVAMYEGGIYGVIVMLTVGLVGGVLNKVIGMHVGVQCMAYYVSVLSVPVLLG
jgi:hypothetical protein